MEAAKLASFKRAVRLSTFSSRRSLRKREGSLDEIRKNQAQAAARRIELAQRLKSRAPAPAMAEPPASEPSAAAPAFDIEAALAAAAHLHLMTFDTSVGDPSALSRPALALLRAFFDAVLTGESASVLQWPLGLRDVSVLHPLAMAVLLRVSEKKTTGKFAWCDPAPCCRTLYFPWRGGANLAGQRYLLRRTDLTDWNKYHLTRQQVNALGTPAGLTDKLHETIGHLDRLRARETTKPHLAHPALSELYPVFAAQKDGQAFARVQNELFGRVSFGAALGRMTDHRPALAAPADAPYGLYGVAHDADLRRALGARCITGPGRTPQICVLDLNAPGLKHLGRDWAERTEQFITEVMKRFLDIPFLAVTNDPFVHRKAENILRGRLRPKRPASKIIVRTTQDLVSVDPLPERWPPVEARFSTTGGLAADAVAALSEAARGSSDPVLAATLRREMGALRKAASLPCGHAAAYDLLCAELGQAQAETFLATRSAASLLAPIDDALASEITGAERARIAQARTAVDKAFRTLDDETPIGSLTAEVVEAIIPKSSRSIVAFASKPELLLAQYRFADDSEAGQRLSRKLERKAIHFTAMDELPGVLAAVENDRDRNSWKRLILIAPGADQLAATIMRGWLPAELIVICERTLASRIADNYRRLSTHADLSGPGQLGARLAAIATAAEAEINARGAASIDLELTPAATAPEEDEDLIDLLDDDDDDDGPVITFNLASGRRLRARPGAAIIRYNPDAEFNPFERAAARDIRPLQSIVVPDRTFVAEAREILPITVLAASWVDVYHTMVEAQIPNIAGGTMRGKARTIIAHMQRHGARTPSEAAVIDWLKVSEHRQLPPEQRRPHAPQRWREFAGFLGALGIDEGMAERMWKQGVDQLRNDRRKAGQRMAKAFVSVLIDPHGTASGFSRDMRNNIKALRKKALDHLDQVTSREQQDEAAL
ncbi:MAG: hypothetical protein AB7J28_03825 [Hyphomonadaceae bacterium]